MFILEDVVSACSDPVMASVLGIIKKFFNVIQIVGPILAIVGGAIALVKLMSNPDEKKYKPLIKNIIIALVLVLLLPTIVNVVMGLFDDSFTISSCWNATFINLGGLLR